MRKVLTLCALLFVLACSTDAQQATPGGQDVAARIGDRAVSMRELDDRWRQTDAGQFAQAQQALYDGRKQALDDMLAEALIAQAAKAKGQTAAQYEAAEITSRSKPVTDADVSTFYAQNREQMQGRPIEAVSGPIKTYLEDRQRATARETLIAELSKTGPAVRMLFDAPRQEVAVAPGDPVTGPASAPVTIVEFSDFQCPFCQRVEPTMKQLRATYGDKIRIVWKDFPLTSVHPQAFESAQAGACARDQGKFWEYHDQLFANQQALQRESLLQYASAVGMDAAKFKTCLESAQYEGRVRDAMAAGSKQGVTSTPTVFVNGRMVTGAQPYEVFASIIDDELQRTAKK